VADVSRELEQATQTLGLSYASIGRDVGLSAAQVGRIAHGGSPDLSIRLATVLLAAVGLELSVRAYPSGRPLRDTPQLELLSAFREHLHPRLSWATEVPVVVAQGRAFDLRAWDATISGATLAGRPIAGESWRYGVEAETRIRDGQAVERRIALKVRDGDVDGVIVAVKRTRSNRTALLSLGAAWEWLSQVPGPIALERLAAGMDPGGNAVIVL
jgi:hypothetical protein